jgi:peptidoglycan lytic transglycosylase G
MIKPKVPIVVPYSTKFNLKMARVFTITALSVLILLTGVFLFLKTNAKPVSTDKSNIMFVVNTGDSLVNISKNLKSKLLIRNKVSFLFHSYTLGLNKKIQAGTFRLSPSLSTQETITKLSKGGVSDYWLKIIDGTRIEEIEHLFPTKLPSTIKEGYIFPDSYLIPTYFTTDQVLEVIRDNFDQKFAKAKKGATTKKLTNQEILILASIIEREARTLKSKQKIAGILLNRLGIGMALQVDASVQYARDSKNNPIEYWKPLKKTDLSIISPFNTYKNPGLPPSSICNPGYNSIYAAFHPISSNYLYYITGSDNLMHYATTLDQHNSNIVKYLK